MPSVDDVDLRLDEPLHPVYSRFVAEGIAGTGILASGDLDVTATATDLEIQVAAGTLWSDGAEHELASAETHTLSQGDGSDDRWDTVYFDTGTDSSGVREGTAGAGEPPDVQVDEVLLAWVDVASGATDVADADIFTFRPTHQDAANTRFDDAAWAPSASTVKAALDELQEAAAIGSHPLGLDEDTDMDVGGTDLTDDTTILYEASSGFFRNEVVQALANFTGDEQFNAYPIELAADTDRDLDGTDLEDAGTTIWDTSEGHVPAAVVELEDRWHASTHLEVQNGEYEICLTRRVPDQGTFVVEQLHAVTADGGPLASSDDVTISTFDDAGGGQTAQQTVFSGDGSDVSEVTSEVSYQNTTGSPQTVALTVENASGGSEEIIVTAVGRIDT